MTFFTKRDKAVINFQNSFRKINERWLLQSPRDRNGMLLAPKQTGRPTD